MTRPNPPVSEPEDEQDGQVLSYELQRDLHRVVELLLTGYKTWLAKQALDDE